jgi:hypothetical protein
VHPAGTRDSVAVGVAAAAWDRVSTRFFQTPAAARTPSRRTAAIARGYMHELSSYFEVETKSGTAEYYGAYSGYTAANERLAGMSVPLVLVDPHDPRYSE